MKTARWIVGLACFGLMIGLAGTARAETNLHLLGERFRVSATWRTADGATGTATAVPLTGETGIFWFFTPGNVELVVKVLDACAPPFERFWIYASGLTDVEVELTVVDTWTGQSKSYHRPRGALFAPLADTSTFNGCGAVRACGRGTIAEIAATPRPNEEAETLALLLGPGITADPEIYARLDAELALIRTLSPSLASVEFRPGLDPSGLGLGLTPEAHAAAQAGQLKEWDCLNAWYHGEVTRIAPYPWADVRFEGRFHTARIAADYLALPGVVLVEPVGRDYPSIPLTDLCVAIDGDAYDYFLNDLRDLWYFRVPQAGATPVLVGKAGGSGPLPDWWPRYTQCVLRLGEAGLR